MRLAMAVSMVLNVVMVFCTEIIQEVAGYLIMYN